MTQIVTITGRRVTAALFIVQGGTGMQDRINTPLTNEHFVAFCQSMVGQPYWYGTCVRLEVA